MAQTKNPAARAPNNLTELRESVARVEGFRAEASDRRHLSTRIRSIDSALPGGGLAFDTFQEVTGTGADTEHGAAPALFVARQEA